MREIDWKLAAAVKEHWQGRATPGITPCPLLTDFDRLLVYLDEIGLKPGHAVASCPACSDEHRWALIKQLMSYALEVFPDRRNALLEAVDRNLGSVRALYGGDEGYREMQKGAAEFFAKVDADNG